MISVPRSRERSMASQIRRVLPSRSPTVVLIWAKQTRSILAPATNYTAVGQSRNRAVAGTVSGGLRQGYRPDVRPEVVTRPPDSATVRQREAAPPAPQSIRPPGALR